MARIGKAVHAHAVPLGAQSWCPAARTPCGVGSIGRQVCKDECRRGSVPAEGGRPKAARSRHCAHHGCLRAPLPGKSRDFLKPGLYSPKHQDAYYFQRQRAQFACMG